MWTCQHHGGERTERARAPRGVGHRVGAEDDGRSRRVVVRERPCSHDDAVKPRRPRLRTRGARGVRGGRGAGDVAARHGGAGGGEVKDGEGATAVQHARERVGVMHGAGDRAGSTEGADEGAGGGVALELGVEDAEVRVA